MSSVTEEALSEKVLGFEHRNYYFNQKNKKQKTMIGKVGHINEVPLELVKMEGAKDIYIQWLITKEDGAPHFAMRRFVVKPEGYSPLHAHPYEHEVFVLSGKGQVQIADQTYDIEQGSFVYVPANEQHQFRNTSQQDLEFLCIIPNV